MMSKQSFARVLLSILLILTVGWVFAAGTSEGACGAAASSCKNCHEVKGEMPVNAKGAYHTQHAFGDFCVFCHSGNTAATDKAEAHQGMVKPLADLEKSCSSCHPDDFQKRGEGYGAASKSESGSGPEPSAPTEDTAYIRPPTPDPSAVKPGDLVDYNLLASAGTQAGQAATEAAAETPVKQEEEAAPVPEPAEAKGTEAAASNVPLIVGVIVVVGVALLFMVFRKK